MHFQNILVPYDGSSNSVRAFKTALDLARKYNSKIIIITCLELSESDWLFQTQYEKALRKKMEGYFKKEIAELEIKAKNFGISVTSRVMVAHSVIKAIVSFSKSKKIDLIVMGSHGKKQLDKLMLGSVTNGVIQRVKCPVLVIK